MFGEGAMIGVVSEGATEEEAAELIELMLSSRAFFTLSIREAVVADPLVIEGFNALLAVCGNIGNGKTEEPVEGTTVAGELYDCVQVNEGYRELFKQGAVFGGTIEGFTEELAADLTEYMLSNREFFVKSYTELIAEEPSMLDLLRLSLDACTSSINEQVDPEDRTLAEFLVGDLFDCLQENEAYMQEYRREYAAAAAELLPMEEATALAELMVSSREFFISAHIQGGVLDDPDLVAELGYSLAECQGS